MKGPGDHLRILYGVQGMGQGHLTRARVLGPALQQEGAHVDFLFSGRPRAQFFDMEAFGAFEVREGLTFRFNKEGRVDNLKTVFQNNAAGFLRDVRNLDTGIYDLIITDYEPVTAWAARYRGIPSIGIGHQYAFAHDIPVAGFNPVSRATMNKFAPAQHTLGLHWHHFGQPILPPLFDRPRADRPVQENKIVAYLNFEKPEKVEALLKNFPDYDFYFYSGAIKEKEDRGHIKLRPLSVAFREDIEDCAGIICGAGFELPSEALHMGKKLLVKPMDGQPEQASNALALERLGLGAAMNRLDRGVVADWLKKPGGRRIVYPDTACAVAKWVVSGEWNNKSHLIHDLWERTEGFPKVLALPPGSGRFQP